MKIIKKIIRKILYRYKADSNTYIKYLRKKGIKIGDNVELFSLNNMHIDDLNPHLLEIGNNVNIVGTEILTHDYSWSVIKGITGEILGNQKKVNIGNNVFIGHGSIILCGTTIEDNTIIGANSVVTGHLKGNMVYAGNPVKPIMTIDDYICKRREAQYKEAKNICKEYKERFNKNPDIKLFHEYFSLFYNSQMKLPKIFETKLGLCGNYKKSQEVLKSNVPMFENFEQFLDSCNID